MSSPDPVISHERLMAAFVDGLLSTKSSSGTRRRLLRAPHRRCSNDRADETASSETF